MKYSKQRSLILEVLQNNPCHPTAEQVFALVKELLPDISLATIYRNLNQLTENGIIKKLDYIDNVSHFDYCTEKHYHFVCSKCSKIFDIKANIIPEIKQSILKQQGLTVEDMEISFSGLCPDCLKNSNN